MKILVLDSQTFEWLGPMHVNRAKTGWADGEFTPVRFERRS